MLHLRHILSLSAILHMCRKCPNLVSTPVNSSTNTTHSHFPSTNPNSIPLTIYDTNYLFHSLNTVSSVTIFHFIMSSQHPFTFCIYSAVVYRAVGVALCEGSVPLFLASDKQNHGSSVRIRLSFNKRVSVTLMFCVSQ